MQEDIENRSVALCTNAAKMTARTLADLMRVVIHKMNETHNKPVEGKQSMKHLSKGGSLSSVEITNDNIKAFDPIARKYNISYSLKKDTASEPPRWVIFFRAKDADSMTAAFKEFTAKMVKRGVDKPSVHETMQKFREVVKNVFRDITKHKHRGGREL